ncbi:unnamed protein product [Wuchereria bancrofti]|uniref:Uncharacterized protein n=1 Tax=Wuchereria bancrofti TaxID=6293 RepID=A0A3P7DPH3_WUCBA|nr:unnamed protein product [Wuchereria bancrofti]
MRSSQKTEGKSQKRNNDNSTCSNSIHNRIDQKRDKPMLPKSSQQDFGQEALFIAKVGLDWGKGEIQASMNDKLECKCAEGDNHHRFLSQK